MRILSDKEDKEIREAVKEKYGLIQNPDDTWEPVDLGEKFTLGWEGKEKYSERLRKTFTIAEKPSEDVFILAYNGGQYVSSAEKCFEEKYNSNIFEITEKDLEEASKDLIVFYLIPEDLSWIVLSDHDGKLHFAGEIKEKAQEKFGGG